MTRSKYSDKMSPDLTKAGQGVIQQLAHRDLEDRLEAVEGDVGELDVVTLTSLGGAALTEPFVTVSATTGLSAERVLTGTSNQVTVTDGGANSTVTLSTPQNLHTEADFQVDTIGVGAAPAANTKVSVNNDAATDTTLYALAHATQSADLVKLLASDGTTMLFGVDASGDLFQHGGGPWSFTGGEFSFNINAGPTDILVLGQKVEINRDENATAGEHRLLIHQTSAQTGNLLDFHAAGGTTSLASVDSTGKLIATTGIRNPHRMEFTANAISLTGSTVAWDVGNATFIRVAANAGLSVGGITNGVNGRVLFVVAATNPITFTDSDAGAAAADRIRTNTLADLTLNSSDMAIFIYDATTTRWRMFKYLTAGSETISGDWTFNGQVIIEDTGQLIIHGKPSATGQPSLYFFNEDNGFTQTIYSTDDLADGSLYGLPIMNGGSDIFAMVALTQTLSNKTMATSTRFAAASDNTMTLTSSASKAYKFTTQATGTVATDSNIMVMDGDVVTLDGDVVLLY